MAGIDEYLQLISSAVYGRDVRNAIHDSIQQCYSDVQDTSEAAQAASTAATAASTAAQSANTAADRANTAAALIEGSDSVISVNGQTGIVVLEADDVGAASSAEAVPSGGTTGQALVKTSAEDHDTEWADIVKADDALTLEEINASTDLTGKIASAQALKDYRSNVSTHFGSFFCIQKKITFSNGAGEASDSRITANSKCFAMRKTTNFAPYAVGCSPSAGKVKVTVNVSDYANTSGLDFYIFVDNR